MTTPAPAQQARHVRIGNRPEALSQPGYLWRHAYSLAGVSEQDFNNVRSRNGQAERQTFFKGTKEEVHEVLRGLLLEKALR